MRIALGADSDDRLNAVLVEYVEAVERGERPDRQRVLASFPERARELAAFFATRDRLEEITAPLRAVAGPDPSHDTGPVPAFDGPAATRPDVSPRGAELGSIGDFRLLREVGRGGMGVVYEAEQLSLRRRVALKVLPFVSALDPRHLQRFRNEAQAAAQLHHTHIVPVFAVGAERGVHYYAMQFIDGQSLSQLLSDLRAADADAKASGAPTPLAGGPVSAERASRRRQYFRRVAGLMKQAAEALDYAHQVGVVHRDVKPANLMLDDAGRLWVTDFGLAQMRNDTGLTATGEVLGTARYMSPEQAAGERGVVDHRTDIYSLGATLYELLTLAPVFDAEDGRALLYQVAYKEARPPRAVDRSVPVELETIVLKALAKMPDERYRTARELAADLQRFLDDRPVLARRPSFRDRTAKWVRRHRALVAVAAGVFLFATVGLTISTALVTQAYQREREAKEHESQRAKEAEQERTQAEQNYQRTRRAVDMFVELSDEEQFNFLPLTGLRMRLLETAIAYYQELSDSRADPQVRASLEDIKARVARLHDELTALNEVTRLLLLEQPVVCADLGLSREAVTRLTPALQRLWSYRQGPEVRDSQEARQQPQIAELAAAARKEVQETLTVAQYQRLRQIFLQIPGPHVFGRSVLDELGLVDAQRDQIRRIRSAALRDSLKLWSTAETRCESQRDFEEMWKRTNNNIAAQLNPAQLEKWKAMRGAPAPAGVQFPLHNSTRTRTP
ncbi:serine/threonine protein kinase [Gemmata sp. JC673]|uniref:Serine/threonine protein kinase n=1 Tax=Gemmata algarum TaxID=2975278 RepID=A0ABU5F5S1_9BACT|nr:serine/threonine-protein kinase [Gemmata algarum]MDY3562839.1 serine/threonine protein kinase [Gemmata algarum]